MPDDRKLKSGKRSRTDENAQVKKKQHKSKPDAPSQKRRKPVTALVQSPDDSEEEDGENEPTTEVANETDAEVEMELVAGDAEEFIEQKCMSSGCL